MKLFSGIILLFFSLFSYSQNLNIDSLVTISSEHNRPVKEFINKDVRIKGFVHHNDFQYVHDEIEKSIGKYPVTFLLAHLEKVEIAGYIINGKSKAQGYFFDKTIYIGSKNNYELEKTFHQQFSLLLLKNYPLNLDTARWKTFSERAVRPSFDKKTFWFFKRKTNPVLYFENGYLAETGLANLKSDFTTYAENLFSGGKQFWMLVDAYPKIREKTVLAISFYHNLYPVFTEKWFRFLAEYRLF